MQASIKMKTIMKDIGRESGGRGWLLTEWHFKYQSRTLFTPNQHCNEHRQFHRESGGKKAKPNWNRRAPAYKWLCTVTSLNPRERTAFHCFIYMCVYILYYIIIYIYNFKHSPFSQGGSAKLLPLVTFSWPSNKNRGFFVFDFGC